MVRPLLSPQEVRERIRALLSAREPRATPVAGCDGLVLAESVVTATASPRARTAAMDGFAVRASDTPGRLQMVGHAYAGQPCDAQVGTQEAVAVATGGWVPEGADAVVEVELATGSTEVIQVPGVDVGRNVRQAGEDLTAGTELLPPGTHLGPLQLAAATGIGRSVLRVEPAPIVAIVPTGDEVRSPGADLLPGQVHDAVTAALAALLRESGAQPVCYPLTPDDPAALATSLHAAAAAADLVLSVGGVSVGARDIVAAMPDAQPLSVALHPGRPLVLGRVDGVAWCGLPGNPVAALAAFEELIRPVLGAPPRVTVQRLLAASLIPKPDRLSLLPCRIRCCSVEALDPRRVGPLTALAAADGWLAVEPGRTALARGAKVDVRLLRRPHDESDAIGSASCRSGAS